MAAIDSLVRSRLIRREERDGHVRLELTHDVLTDVVRRSRDRRRTEEEAEERTKKERAAAEARARDERARVEALERAAVASRRRTRIVAGLGVVFLVLFAITGVALIEAKRSTERARQSARQALVARQKADSSADSTHRALLALARSDSARALEHAIADSTTLAKNRALTLMNDNLKNAQDSVRLTERKAIVEAEAADQYLSLSGRLRSWRAAADSAFAATVRKTVDSATALQFEARRQSENQAKLLADALCLSPQGKELSSDTAGVRVRSGIRQQLESSGLLGRDLCAANPNKAGAGSRLP
jgi:hypothetical protein